jgi:hypothetical protein
MDKALTVFISHKMPRDSKAASSVGQLIASNSGSKIKISVAENFKKGRRLTPEITAATQSADIFVLLYTGEDEDWGYCLLEAGQFEAIIGDDNTRSIGFFTSLARTYPRRSTNTFQCQLTRTPSSNS